MERWEAFESWAPPSALWSRWAKPVLFAEAQEFPSTPPGSPAAPPSILPSSDGGTAVIIDLPGAQAVQAGLALAGRGFRPVPLFNGNVGPEPVVEVAPLSQALFESADTLARVGLADEAPPAFLLDSNRLEGSASPGRFDNRWRVFPQDLPSATFLKAHGITRVVLLAGASAPADDLAHVLQRFKEAGIPIDRFDPDSGSQATLDIVAPPRFRNLWYRALAIAGLKRSSAGGFGSVVPIASSAGSGYRSFG